MTKRLNWTKTINHLWFLNFILLFYESGMCVHAQSLQLCPLRPHRLSFGHGILQARILEWVIFPMQGSNPCLLCILHRRQILYCWVTREALQNRQCLAFRLLVKINKCKAAKITPSTQLKTSLCSLLWWEKVNFSLNLWINRCIVNIYAAWHWFLWSSPTMNPITVSWEPAIQQVLCLPRSPRLVAG